MLKQISHLVWLFFFFCGSYTITLGQETYRLAHIFSTDDGLASNHITSLTRYRSGIVVIGTQNGLNLYDGYTFEVVDETTPFPLNSNKVNSMEIGRDKSSWVGTTNGINVLDPFKGANQLFFNKENLKYPPLKSDTISNTLLTSTPNGIIWIVNNGIICQVKNGKVKQYFPEKHGTTIKILGDDQNNVFAFANESLIGLNTSGKLLFELKEFTSPLFGLQQISEMSNLFKTKKGEIIIEDHLNNRYFKVNTLGKIEDVTTENHWLPIFFKELDQQAKAYNIRGLRKFDFLETEEGLIWVATNSGLIKMVINSPDLLKSKKIPNHFITRYKKYNSSTEKLISLFLNPDNIEPITLSPKELYLEFKFINNDFSSPLKNKFSHYLEGFESDFLPFNNKNSVSYSNLPAGEYKFKLKSKNAKGIESESIFEIPITVKQAFYKSAWFLGALVAIVLGLIILFIRYKFTQERKLTRLRNRMASDLHDEVSNSLNNIRIIAKETDYSNQEKMKSDFHRIQKMSTQAIEHVEDVIWSIDDNYKKAESLFFKMEDYLDDVLRAKNIPVRFIREGLNNNADLGFIYRRNMLLIFKEAISNIVKHTKPLDVYILYKKTTDGYIMKIRNTFEERIDAENSTKKGLIGMKQRAEAMGSSMKFTEKENLFEVFMEKKFH